MALFTKENAAEMGRRSAEAKKTLKLESAEPAIPTVVSIQSTDESTVPTYAEKRLTRIRIQLNTLDCRLEVELMRAKPDTRAIKELIDAQYRLAEQERFLDGRPAPGQFRPELKRQSRSSPRLDMDTTITVVEPTEQTAEKSEDTKTSPLG